MIGRAIAPPPLAEGDAIAVIAPSGPFDHERFLRGVSWLSARYRVKVRGDVEAREGFLGGDDARRSRELQDAVDDHEIRAIVAARGGYGATRITSAIDWTALTRDPKWIVGFSDVTALHVEASRVAVRSIHASMAASLGDADEAARARWLDVVEGRPLPAWDELTVAIEGQARGPMFGGNLALLHDRAAAGRLVVPVGAIVLLEDCGERPYRLDRMLTSLLDGGHLAGAAAFVVGELIDCKPGLDGVTASQVVSERLGRLGRPLVTGAPFGHGARNEPFIVGAMAHLIGDRLRFLDD